MFIGDIFVVYVMTICKLLRSYVTSENRKIMNDELKRQWS